jgi:hypothetical protein
MSYQPKLANKKSLFVEPANTPHRSFLEPTNYELLAAMGAHCLHHRHEPGAPIAALGPLPLLVGPVSFRLVPDFGKIPPHYPTPAPTCHPHHSHPHPLCTIYGYACYGGTKCMFVTAYCYSSCLDLGCHQLRERSATRETSKKIVFWLAALGAPVLYRCREQWAPIAASQKRFCCL